jgi:hypothetical protein
LAAAEKQYAVVERTRMERERHRVIDQLKSNNTVLLRRQLTPNELQHCVAVRSRSLRCMLTLD